MPDDSVMPDDRACPGLAETSTPEQLERFWRDRQPVMDKQRAVVDALLPTLIGKTLEQARAEVHRTATEAGVPLTLRMVDPVRAIPGIYAYGRITVWMRDGVVASADAW